MRQPEPDLSAIRADYARELLKLPKTKRIEEVQRLVAELGLRNKDIQRNIDMERLAARNLRARPASQYRRFGRSLFFDEEQQKLANRLIDIGFKELAKELQANAPPNTFSA
jgi:hypothetical protein